MSLVWSLGRGGVRLKCMGSSALGSVCGLEGGPRDGRMFTFGPWAQDHPSERAQGCSITTACAQGRPSTVTASPWPAECFQNTGQLLKQLLQDLGHLCGERA